MSEVRKSQKQNPLLGRLEAPLKAKPLRFQPRSIMGARETLSRVEMNAQLRGALDSVSRAGAPVCLFSLDEGRCRHTRDDDLQFSYTLLKPGVNLRLTAWLKHALIQT